MKTIRAILAVMCIITLSACGNMHTSSKHQLIGYGTYCSIHADDSACNGKERVKYLALSQ
jgi:uncharacterized lipoprotein